jgi:hypothetical protein
MKKISYLAFRVILVVIKGNQSIPLSDDDNLAGRGNTGSGLLTPYLWCFGSESASIRID